MKRDWDLLRKLLTDIEEERNPFADLPDEPSWKEQDEDTYNNQLDEYWTIEKKLFGHLELLVNSGYIDGLKLSRLLDGGFHYVNINPRLTMEGHDLLDTMRSSVIWENIKETAKSKGIELTFDAIKALGAFVLKAAIG